MARRRKTGEKYLYAQLAEQLRDQIVRGEFATGQLPTEQQLVHSSGMSVITVRKALSQLAKDRLIVRKQGHGTFIKGWNASPATRLRRTSLLSYISAAGTESVAGSFFNRLMIAAQHAAEAHGYSTVLSNARSGELPLPLRKRRVDAVILAGIFRAPEHGRTLSSSLDEENLTYLRRLAESGFPIVSISNHAHWPAVHRVLPDYAGAMQRALELLGHHGHQRVALWGGPFAWPPFRERLNAFRRAAQMVGMTFGDEDVLAFDHFAYLDRAGTIQAMQRWIHAHPKHTALILVSGAPALALRAIAASGRKVPEQVSVLALSDHPPPQSPSEAAVDVDEEISPQTTAFEIPVQAMAESAIERAVRLADGRTFREVERVLYVPLIHHLGATIGRVSGG